MIMNRHMRKANRYIQEWMREEGEAFSHLLSGLYVKVSTWARKEITFNYYFILIPVLFFYSFYQNLT